MELAAAKTQRRINKSDKEKMVFNEGNIRSSSCIFFFFFYMKLMNQNGFDGGVGGSKRVESKRKAFKGQGKG